MEKQSNILFMYMMIIQLDSNIFFSLSLSLSKVSLVVFENRVCKEISVLKKEEGRNI